MKIVGMLRVKNESRWIERVIMALLPLCEHIFVLDDHSGDGTPELCRAFGESVTVFDSPFLTLDEARDKDWLLQQIAPHSPDWIMACDGDEVLTAESAEILRQAIASGRAPAYCPRIVYLWNDEQTERVDGIYGSFYRARLWKFQPGQKFRTTSYGANFHCGSVPDGLTWERCAARLLHFGYLHQHDRLRKFLWYNEIDRQNVLEDCYRHMIQGDLPEVPSNVKLRHAGPLRLEQLTVPEFA